MPNLPYDIYASVTERGQVTIPAEVRKALGLTKPGKVIFRIEDGIVVVKKAPFQSIAEIAGSLPRLDPPMTWEEIEQAVDEDRAAAFREKTKRESAE